MGQCLLYPQKRTSAALFDHPIGTQQDGRRQFDADRLCSFEIHDHLEFARPLKRQVGRLRTLYDLVDERCSAPKKLGEVDAESQKTIGLGVRGKTN
jgi:hypothetical protein